MKEDYIETLRQQDTNLRDAIRLEEEALPPMPADLNARLMQRVAKEEKKPRRIVWPWIAAACAAGVLMIWLTPPKVTPEDVVAKQKPKVEQQTPSPALPSNGKEVVSPEAFKVEESAIAKAETEKASRRTTPRQEKTENAQMTPPSQAEEPATDLLAVQETEVSTPLPSGEGQGGGSVVTLTERDIPITRPENYKYTPEEIALLKQQANEAYLKWVELELEISKYTLEKMAQK
ncbi:MAG: hypothetical protein SPK34_06785 [Bacteroidaceae bacterium]|nr:hypothetical protein [Bacteroidaceae bacterium]MCI6802242.1 hypothetical protein [Prevotellaceae bacterium]MDD6017243.1 hypothetical protein [Prevotellaceae bacterium]MDD7526665.1 hypothetical protein [Prevotellaceae bacterium]MDY5760619.1 hypothetical protein [Bacteroidaceae bacterium]